MENKYHSIFYCFLSCFAENILDPQVIENEDYLQYTWKLNYLKEISGVEFNLSTLNFRDKLTLTISQYDNEISSYHSEDANFDYQDFWDNLNAISTDEPINFVLKITKYKQENVISVYEFTSFFSYLKSMAINDYLSLFDKLIKPYIIFEIQDINFTSVKANNIAFVNKTENLENLTINEMRVSKVEFRKTHTFSTCEDLSLLPDDFYINTECSELEKLLRAVSQLLSFIYISDVSKIMPDTINFRINGYKIVTFDKELSKISDLIVFKTDSCDLLFKIYEWIYTNKDIDERIVIARNIISLNIESNDMILDNLTLEAIKSNYKIFEKENVDRYINVRNEISGILIDLQDKIQSIISDFIDDFRKSIFTILSFFISVIVINVISSGNFVTCFTKPVIILGITFITISFIYLLISRWNLNEKKKMYEKHYLQIKNRYKDILSKNELKSIFEDCDPNITESKKNYLEQQEKIYSISWFISLIVLLLSTIELYKCNIGESLLINLINSLPL